MGTETKPQYSPGLAGVIAGETAICWVDPAAGLMYRGYDIHQMAEKATFEEVAYLLLNGELPNAKQLKDFTQQIAGTRELPGAVTEMLRLLPSDERTIAGLSLGRIHVREHEDAQGALSVGARHEPSLLADALGAQKTNQRRAPHHCQQKSQTP